VSSNRKDNVGVPRLEQRLVDKPWGREEWLVVGERIVMKKLVVSSGHRLSLQYHEQKEEAWLLLSGRARVRYAEAEEELGSGAVVHVPPGTVHRIEAVEDVVFLEVSTPELDDVVRIDDDFGREGTSDA